MGVNGQVYLCVALYVGSVTAVKCYVCDSSSLTCKDKVFVPVGTATEEGCTCCKVCRRMPFVIHSFLNYYIILLSISPFITAQNLDTVAEQRVLE